MFRWVEQACTGLTGTTMTSTRLKADMPLGPARPATVLPRTHVNSAMRLPYIPAAEPAVRPGSNDHRRYATKGNPT